VRNELGAASWIITKLHRYFEAAGIFGGNFTPILEHEGAETPATTRLWQKH
jgi:hypothetical protein